MSKEEYSSLKYDQIKVLYIKALVEIAKRQQEIKPFAANVSTDDINNKDTTDKLERLRNLVSGIEKHVMMKEQENLNNGISLHQELKAILSNTEELKSKHSLYSLNEDLSEDIVNFVRDELEYREFSYNLRNLVNLEKKPLI